MSHYRSNLRDIEFNLFEVLGADYFGTGPFEAVDGDQARMLLAEPRPVHARVDLGRLVRPGRPHPAELSPEGDITIPDELDQALRAFYEAGWHLLPLPTHLGGYGAPPSIRWAGSELLSGGHATAMLWPIGALMAAIIDQIGTEGQKARFVRPMIEDCWGGTMVLTEPDAGSDVGAGTTRAIRVEDNGPDDLGAVYHLEGIKRFITSADAQTHPNTVHLVLARPEGAGPGTKGLSLFVVPKLPRRRPTGRSVTATASGSATSRRRWASRARRPASSRSARTARPASATSSATSTTASARCSWSSSTPA